MATIKMPVFKKYPFEKNLGESYHAIISDRFNPDILYLTPYKGNYLYIYSFRDNRYKKIALPGKDETVRYSEAYQIYTNTLFMSCSDKKIGGVLIDLLSEVANHTPTDYYMSAITPYKNDTLIGTRVGYPGLFTYNYFMETYDNHPFSGTAPVWSVTYVGNDIVVGADSDKNHVYIFNLKTKKATRSVALHKITKSVQPLSIIRIDDDHIASIPRSNNDLVIYQVSTDKVVERIVLAEDRNDSQYNYTKGSCLDGVNIWMSAHSLDHDAACYNLKTKELTHFTETGVNRKWKSIDSLYNGRFALTPADQSNIFKVVSIKEIETEYKPLVKDAVDLTSFVETEDRTFQQCTGEDDYIVNQQGQDILYLTFPSTNTRNCPTLNGVLLKRGDGGNIYRGDLNPDTPYVVANNQIVNTEHLGSNELRRSRFGESLGNMEKFYIGGAAEKHCIAADTDKLFITSRVVLVSGDSNARIYGYLFDSLTNTVKFFGTIGTLRKNKYPLKCMARVDDSRVILIGPSEFPSFVYDWKIRGAYRFPKHTKSTNSADCCLLKDGRIFAPNYNADYGVIYDCKSMTFEYIPPAPLYNTPLPKSRIRAVCPSRDNKVYCAGYELRSNAYIYDVDKKSWKVLTETSRKSMMGVVLMPDGSGCFTGGWRTGNRRLMKYTSDGTLSEHLEVNSDGYTYAVYGSALTPDGHIVMHNGNNEGSRVERKHVILTSSNNELLHVFDAGDVNYYGATILGEGNAFCVGHYIYRLHLGGSRASKEQVTSMYYNRS